MPYIHKTTKQYPISEQDIRSLNPNTSFPSPFTAPDDYALVFPSPQPAYDPLAQSVRELAPVFTVKDTYEQAWEVIDLDPEQAAANKDAAMAATLKSYERALDGHLDGVANQFRFDDRKALSLRAAYPNAWHDLAVAYGTWMDSCNVIAYQGLQDVIDGKRTLPSIDDFIAELPVFSYVA